MGVNYGDLIKFKDELNALEKKRDEFLEDCTKELAARLLRKVIKRTPVGQYPAGSGKMGGTLRRGWTNGKDPAGFVNSISVKHVGNSYRVEIINPVEYAPYVEYGHRKRGGKGWVKGRFMLTISEQELSNSSQAIIERKIKTWLGGVL